MITTSHARWLKPGVLAVFLAAASVALTGVAHAQTQAFQTFPRGQNVAPAFEGWEENADGSFNLVFGYFNRNWEEYPVVAIGANNAIEPGGPDQGQPTLFLPRRNKFVFRVRVPKDFGTKELVWTLTVNGKTERAYATLKPDYKLDSRILQTNAHMRLGTRGYAEFENDISTNKAPIVKLDGEAKRTVKVGEVVSLNALVTDDGKMKRYPARAAGVNADESAIGLRVTWFVYRGAGDKVTFDPPQFKVYPDKRPGGNSPWTPGWAPPALPADNRFPVKVTFSAPGTYVVRLLAHDGGLDTAADITVNVVGAPTASTGSAR